MPQHHTTPQMLDRNVGRGRWCHRAVVAFNMSRWGWNSVGSAVIDVDVDVLLVCGDVAVVLWRVFEADCDERSCWAMRARYWTGKFYHT